MQEAGQRLQQAQQGVIVDNTRVFGYSGGVTHLIMDACDSGLSCNPIKGGTLLTFATPEKHGYRGAYNSLKREYPQHYVVKTPSDNAYTVEREFRIKKDQGYRNLTPLKSLPYGFRDGVYADEAFHYFDVLHPEIANCPFDLEKDVRFDNEAFAYIACPTCRLAELKSDACSQRIYEAGANGLDTQILADTRAIMIDACETAVRYTTSVVAELDMDMKKRLSGDHGRTTRNEVDLIHLRQLHRNIPVEDTSAGVNQFAAALTQAMNATAQANAQNDNNEAEMLRMKLELAELRAEKAERELAQQGTTTAVVPPVVTTSEPQIPEPVSPLEPLDIEAEVYVGDKPAIITAKNFGKYDVTFADGTVSRFDRSELVPKEEYAHSSE